MEILSKQNGCDQSSKNLVEMLKAKRMKKEVLMLIILSSFIPAFTYSQLLIVIDELPDNTADNSIIYLAGNVNNWNPHDAEYQFVKNDKSDLVLRLDSLNADELIEFKLTLGSWQIVEISAEGLDIENRTYTFTKPDTLFVQIEGWNNPSQELVKSSASYNVEIINEEFYIPQLDRYRRIWIYLPPDYDVELEKDYPLLYMHDGQNLFDNKTAFSGEWNVDEHLNRLIEEGYSVPIVVGIDNGDMFRGNEYSYEDSEEYRIKHEGDKYLAFIVETLHPFIESHYRTTKNRERIGIMGSSLGGLISAYGLIYYPDIFGLAGIFSPAYWINPSIFNSRISSDLPFRIFQLAGSEESETMERDILMIDSLFQSNFKGSVIKYEIIEGGKHNEVFWSQEFSKAILYLYNTE